MSRLPTDPPPRWEDRLATATIANGQTDGEYASAILDICGIKEEWTPTENEPFWVSSIPEIRGNLERLVRIIKTRVVQNVKDHERAERAVERFDEWLEQEQERAR